MADNDAPQPAEPTSPVTVSIEGDTGGWQTRVQIAARTHPKRPAVDVRDSFTAYDRAERAVRRTLAENGIG